jgi:hypothetical protein
MPQKKGIRVKDLECVGLNPMTQTKGIHIKENRSFLKLLVVAILKDGESNLRLAVDLLNEDFAKAEEKLIESIDDIGHFSAALIKGHYDKNLNLDRLKKLAVEWNQKVCLTSCSFLQAPKARTVGRFMGHGPF